MAIVVRCPDCSKRARLPDSDAGGVTLCAACGCSFSVPAALASEVEGDASPRQSAPGVDAGADAVLAPSSGAGAGAWALVGITALIFAALIGLAVFLSSQKSARAEWRATANQLKDEADDLAANHKIAEARAKYQELSDFVAPHAADDSRLRELAEEARAESAKLAQISIARSAPPAPPVQASVAPVSPAEAPRSSRATGPEKSHAVTGDPVAANPDATEQAAKVVQKPAPSRPAIRPTIDAGDQMSDEQIGKAIQSGVDFLIDQFDPNRFELREGMDIRNRRAARDGFHDGADVLCVYALMQCGDAINDPRLSIRGPFMLGAIEAMKGLTLDDHFATYSRGLRATALALNNRVEDKKTLRADVAALLKTSIKGGYTYYDQAVTPARRGEGIWDNSNSQYGLLGVWSGAEAEVEVPSTYWQEVEKHWTTCQSPGGQWGYVQGSEGSGRLTMTCAGIASLFVCHDWLDAPKFGNAVGREPFSPALKKGLAWLEQGDHSVGIRTGMWGYGLYGVERVGLASGFKFFGKHNWYPELARQVLQEQNKDGSWGNVVDTAYALLFLSRGRHPILMNKLRYDGSWANRPRDVANLAREATRQLERPINWQVVPLASDWTDWTDSPILYLASHQPPRLSDADIEKMRQFILAGGMLFVQADGDAPAMSPFASELGQRLFPKYDMVDVPASHPLFSSVYKITTHPPLKMVSNGSRILMLYSPTDISKRWQLREQRGQAGKPVFQLGINMFVYAAGRRDMRNRLDTNLIGAVPGIPSLTIKIARIRYDGNWDPEPYAWTRFSRSFRKQTGYALDVQTAALRDGDAAQTPFAHLTGTTPFAASADEVAGVKKFVESGGVLLVDLNGGSGGFDESFHALLAAAFPNGNPLSLRPPHPLLRAGPPGMEDLTRPRLRSFTIEKLGNNGGNIDIFKASKGHVIFTSLDLTSGLLNTGTWGILGYEPAYAQNFIKNAILWTVDGEKDE